MACIKGEKLESKYPAFAVRKLEFSASSVDRGIRLGRLELLGLSRRSSRRYDILFRRKIDSKVGRYERERVTAIDGSDYNIMGLLPRL
jgi:hypothetical protein